jgi:hypothetical protein
MKNPSPVTCTFSTCTTAPAVPEVLTKGNLVREPPLGAVTGKTDLGVALFPNRWLGGKVGLKATL